MPGVSAGASAANHISVRSGGRGARGQLGACQEQCGCDRGGRHKNESKCHKGAESRNSHAEDSLALRLDGDESCDT